MCNTVGVGFRLFISTEDNSSCDFESSSLTPFLSLKAMKGFCFLTLEFVHVLLCVVFCDEISPDTADFFFLLESFYSDFLNSLFNEYQCEFSF